MAALSFDRRIALKFNYVIRTLSDLHAYQLQAYEFLRSTPFSALFIDLGMGKTITSLTLIADLIRNFETEKVLIIAPLRVATDTWPSEIPQWEHTAPFNFTVIREDDDDPVISEAKAAARSKAKADAEAFELNKQDADKFVAHQVQKAETQTRLAIRKAKARSTTSIHIINREQLEWLVNFWGARWPYRTVIIDESSNFKDHTTNRFQALAKVRRTAGLITRLHLLTATPAAETYEHLWAQIYLLDLGERLGKCITRYRKKYFSENRYSRKWEIREGAEEEILQKLSDITLVMKARDYLNLKEPTIAPRYVKLSDKQRDLYETMQRDCIVELDDGTEIEAETAAALSGKLLQMASGVLYETQLLQDWETEDFKKIKKVHHLHEHKIEMLQQIVDESQGATLLVAYHFKSSLDRLKKAFPKAVVMDKEGKCIKAWNAGKIPMLLVHPQSAGHGLNLQHGGHSIVFFDIPWSLELYLQLIGRLARQGQKNPVLVQLLIATGTLDERVFKSLRQKQDAQDDLFAMLRRLIKKYREGREKRCAVTSEIQTEDCLAL